MNLVIAGRRIEQNRVDGRGLVRIAIERNDGLAPTRDQHVHGVEWSGPRHRQQRAEIREGDAVLPGARLRDAEVAFDGRDVSRQRSGLFERRRLRERHCERAQRQHRNHSCARQLSAIRRGPTCFHVRTHPALPPLSVANTERASSAPRNFSSPASAFSRFEIAWSRWPAL